ncbi:monofunctional biosynthetic peptidoglycan transglycosylase [Aromatoleum diolicum]|uniref:Biosynthetic peptidoglycan transglycosylase n=1 Tax=Aromatoleum diolicum TaxID=75796 RepID=A0ABX1Q8P3_9RHOO|nr:monofunctional biosynthetic peptidoglycan transglycosylase [Aromatoleum diolicum]NMG73887.1 monofunctional biosynthetic peptidoglycan transglycosylase [Aromatoleum diolicum]
MKTALRRIGWALAAVAALVLLYQLWIFTLVLWWNHFNPSTTSFMDLRLDELQEKRPNIELRHDWVPYERISIHLKRAVIAAEDDSFIEHEGFDWEGIQRALEKNQRKGKAVAGGSTISQQLAKNLFLSPSRSYFRKAQEAVITVMIEAVWSKRRILEVYLNVVEWGTGIFGCEAAAQRYYGIPASRLGADQAARLAVMLPNPRKYEKQFGPRLAAHAARIRGRMGYAQVP